MPSETKSLHYDVFISHSSIDKSTVRDLAQRLKNDGLRVWFDEWEIQPGDIIGVKIEEGLQQSRSLLLAMSSNAFASEWVTLERHTALFRDPTNNQRRFIPIRLDDATITDVLKQFAYVDWRTKSHDEYKKLLAACKPTEKRREAVVDQSLEKPKGTILKSKVSSEINCVAITPDGHLAITGSDSGVIRVWDLESNKSTASLTGHKGSVQGVAVTADGRRVISGSKDNTVGVWDLVTRRCLASLTAHVNFVSSVAVTPDGDRAVSGSGDGAIYVWDLNKGRRLAGLEGHTGQLRSVAITPDGRTVVSGAADRTVRVWDVTSKKCIAVLTGHRHWVWSVAISDDGQRVISSSGDGTMRVWEVQTSRCLATLEGHTGAVLAVAVTADGSRAVSGSADNSVRVWDVDAGLCLATLKGHTGMVRGLTMTPDGSRAVSGSGDGTVGVWKIPASVPVPQETEASRYTNAKVLLVGESGVGKSGLAIRLTTGRFENTISTDAAWATQLPLPHDGNSEEVEREIWLWDFAGQADYRLVHQLYLDETALAVLVFNPQSEDPFDGLGAWERDLERAARRPFRKLLVAGRCDRGGLMVSHASIDQFVKQRGFAGFLETSALMGTGCADLRAAIIQNIPWDDIPRTSSPRIFKLLKNEIIKIKDESIKDNGKALLRMAELKQQLEMRLPGEVFSPDELRAVVGLLAGPGVVWQLEFGDFVLLQPERINAYAAAVIRSVRAHTEEIGCISEDRVLKGELEYQDMPRLPASEEQIVLRAMHQTFVDYGLCWREATDQGILLIFPSFFRRERPELGLHPIAFTTYEFSGSLDEIYATLVVRLNHTSAFEKDQLYRFAADFKTQAGKRVGLKMTKKQDGAGQIAIYFEPEIPPDTKVTFIRYVHDHLSQKAQHVVRRRHYVCPDCDTPVESHKAVEQRLARGEKDIVCTNCDGRVPLFDLIEEKFASKKMQVHVRNLAEEALSNVDSESRELILLGHALSIAGEAGQIFRQDFEEQQWGLDGAIEFKNDLGEGSGQRVYLQMRPDRTYHHQHKPDGSEIFSLKEPEYAEKWLAQSHPVMLVVRTSDGGIRWMNVSDYLREPGASTEEIIFQGEPFTALSVVRLRDRFFTKPGALN